MYIHVREPLCSKPINGAFKPMAGQYSHNHLRHVIFTVISV